MYFAVVKDLPKTNVAWKVMANYGSGWFTPIRYIRPKNNKLKARGKLDLEATSAPWYKLYGGVIHCYKTKRAALDSIMYASNFQDVFEVIGKTPIAHTTNQIAFKEIEFVDNLDEWEI